MKDAYYFPHDCNAIDDPKIMVMISELGLESYAIYWILIEHLRQQPNFTSHISIIKPLSLRHGSTETKFMAVLNLYALFQTNDEGYFYSESLINRMIPYLEKSERARNAALKRWHGGLDANALPEHNDSNASKVKESKVKEIINTFDGFWELYNKKVGSKKKCLAKWKTLSELDRKKIFETLPAFLNGIKDKQYQPHPQTYLNNDRWNDELQPVSETKLSSAQRLIKLRENG